MSAPYYGDLAAGQPVDISWNTDVNGAPITLAGSPSACWYVGDSLAQGTTGLTLSVDFDGVTGLHLVHVDTSALAAGNYSVVLATGTVDGQDVAGLVLGSFSLEARSAPLASSYTPARAVKLDQLDAAVTSRSSHSAADVWAAGTRTLTGFGTLVADTAAAVWDRLTSALTTVGSVGKLLVDNVDATISSRLASASYTTPPTVGAIADQVWDEALSGHTTVGSAGAGLTAAGASGDPWATALPGSYAAGTAGAFLPRLDVAVSSRAAAGATLTAVGPVASDFAVTIFENTDYLGPDALLFNNSGEDFSDVTEALLVTVDSAGAAVSFTGTVVTPTQISVEITAADEPAAVERWVNRGWQAIAGLTPYAYEIQVTRSSPARSTIPFSGALIVRQRLAQPDPGP